ncbi:hypothetical protein KAR34_01160 [bacterium]|nr:hypothetical protein [bacterium]
MESIMYRASFFLYEVSFLLLAIALWYHSLSMRKINQALRQPPYWIWTAIGSAMLVMCAFNHYFVYHHISPVYMRNQSHDLLISMYIFKTLSMFYILGAGVSLVVSNLFYLNKTKQ